MIACDPRWDFSEAFFYETRAITRLDERRMTIECFNYATIGKDSLIGRSEVDLFVLATGPVSHELILYDVHI